MVQNFGRVVVAVAALNAAVTLAQSQTNNFELEAREEVPYTRRHVTREERVELEAREFANDWSDLEAREPEPDPLHIPFVSNWNAGRKQRNADRQKGKKERVQAEKGAESKGEESGASTTPGRRELSEPELDVREFDMEELEAREPEPDPLHIPFVSNWNAGRKQRNADRQKGKKERVQAEKGAESKGEESGASTTPGRRELSEPELDAREFDMEELEAREPEPDPLHIPFVSNWNAGRKQRNADRKRGKQERVQADKGAESKGEESGASTTPGRRELTELDAREFDMEELEAREPEPDPLHIPFVSNWNAGRKQRNADLKRGKQERVQAEKGAESKGEESGASTTPGRRALNNDFWELEAREYDFELEAREPEPLHVPFFSDWNTGRKQRNEDRKRGKEQRVEAEKGAGISRRAFDSDLNEFDARSMEFELNELD